MTVSGKTVSPSVRERETRRKRFRAALALADKDAQDFASDVGVTGSHLSLVLNGKRVSASLLQKVDAFIAKYLGAKTAQQPTSATAA